MLNDFSAIILAAGQGTRMNSGLPKVLHEVCGRPMLVYSLDLIRSLKIKNAVVVLGYKDDLVKGILEKGIKAVKQKQLLGTADAVKAARSSVHKKNVLILYGDNPLVKFESVRELINKHKSSSAGCTLLTAVVDNPAGYGRIIRDKYSNVVSISEEKDINAEQKDIREINSGVCCFKRDILFKALDKVKRNNAKKEYYLTGVIQLLSEAGQKIETVQIEDYEQVLGINSRNDLAKAHHIMRMRILNELMLNGVTVVDPSVTYVDNDVTIGQDTIIHPYSIIDRGVKIGKNCSIGPFCHLRSGTVIEDNVRIGNFVEVVRSRIGKFTLAKHFSYLGDAVIGSKVNIGAGTVTANYDGKNKNKTIIKDEAFIGSDSILVAPVKIGRAAITGAGCVVTKNRNVPDKSIVAGVPAKQIK